MLTLTMFSVITRCLGFVYKIYLTKIMSTTELGIYNLTSSIFMVLITLVGASVPLTISKITSNNNSLNKSSETKYSVTSSLIITTSLSLFLSCLLIISRPLISLVVGNSLGYDIMLCLIPAIIFTAIYSQIRGYLWGIENYFAVSMVEFIEQILRILFCMIFVISGIISSPVLAVGTSLSIACGISTIYGVILYFKNGGKFKYKNGYYKEIIKSSLPLTCMRFFGSILQPIIAVIIPMKLSNLGMTNEMALSELGIVMGMTMPLLSIPSTIIGSLCMILVPRININNPKENTNKELTNYLNFTITCIFIFIPVFMALGSEICNFVFGNIDSGKYLSFCAWTMIPMGIAQITTSILNALNQEQKTFIYYITSSLLMVILCLILPNYFGVQAMLIANGISYILLSILNLRKINNLTQFKSKLFKHILIHILLCLPAILLTNFLYSICISFFNTFFSIMITCIISVISYIGLLFVFGGFQVSIVKEYLLKFSKKSKLN